MSRWFFLMALSAAGACANPVTCHVGGREETFKDCNALEEEAGCRRLDEPNTPQSDIDDLDQCLADQCDRGPPLDCNTDGHNV